jgi:hypothetical protein
MTFTRRARKAPSGAPFTIIPGIESVSSVGDLPAPDDGITNGQVVQVLTPRRFYQWFAGSTLPADNVEIVARPGGTWQLLETGYLLESLAQPAWEINGTTGSDNAPGAPGAPLATFREYLRRTGGFVRGQVSMQVTGSFSGGMQGSIYGLESSSQLVVLATPLASTIHTVTASNVQAPATNTPASVTAAALASQVNRRYRATSNGSIAWGAAVVAGDQVATSEWGTLANKAAFALPVSASPPAVGQTFAIDSLPVVTGPCVLEAQGAGGSAVVLAINGLEFADTVQFECNASTSFSPFVVVSECLIRAARLELGSIFLSNCWAAGATSLVCTDLLWNFGGAAGPGTLLQLTNSSLRAAALLFQGKRLQIGVNSSWTFLTTPRSGLAVFGAGGGNTIDVGNTSYFIQNDSAPIWGASNSGGTAGVRVRNVLRYSNLANFTLAHAANQCHVGNLAATTYAASAGAVDWGPATMAFMCPLAS